MIYSGVHMCKSDLRPFLNLNCFDKVSFSSFFVSLISCLDCHPVLLLLVDDDLVDYSTGFLDPIDQYPTVPPILMRLLGLFAQLIVDIVP